MSRSPEQILVGCAREIADWTNAWSWLGAEHTEGPDGRCRPCGSAVRLAPRWPCRIAVLAALAQALHGGEPGGRAPVEVAEPAARRYVVSPARTGGGTAPPCAR